MTWLDVDESQVVPEASLIDDLDADSLNLVELVMAMESEFNLEISAEDMQQVNTVQDVQDYLEQRIAATS